MNALCPGFMPLPLDYGVDCFSGETDSISPTINATRDKRGASPTIDAGLHQAHQDTIIKLVAEQSRL